ncbi:MAG: hypothetical protein IPK32_16430 [Verrucomicrobiaceae bacterium]|nr:hypothetical protein [Verrucomicrobiaceae bacterium]
MMRAGDPARYWAGVHLDLVAQDGRSLTLVMVSDSISGGGLFFDLRPWLWLAAAALLISALHVDALRARHHRLHRHAQPRRRPHRAWQIRRAHRKTTQR